MSDDDYGESKEFGRPPELSAVYLLPCRTIWFDNRKPEAGFSLGGMITHIEPPEGYSFPFRLERIFVYIQYRGDPGEYIPRIRLVRLEVTDDNEEEEIQLGSDRSPREFVLPSRRPMVISGINYVEEISFPIGPVPFRETGLYEFQLWVNGFDTPIGRGRVFARD